LLRIEAAVIARAASRRGLLVSADDALLESLRHALGPAEPIAEAVGNSGSALTLLSGVPAPSFVLLDGEMNDAGRVMDAVRAANGERFLLREGSGAAKAGTFRLTSIPRED